MRKRQMNSKQTPQSNNERTMKIHLIDQKRTNLHKTVIQQTKHNLEKTIYNTVKQTINCTSTHNTANTTTNTKTK